MADDTGDQLIKVAREILAKRGYLGLTMKTASAAAGVTPDVAMRYFRNRDALIAAALRLPSDPITAIPTLVAPGVEGMGERLVRYMLDVLRDPQTRAELVSLARTGVNAGHAMAGLQDFLERAIVDRVATTIGVPDARMRSALITSYLLGVAMTRYGVRLEPLASASEEDVVRMVAPVIQDLLDPRKPLPGSTRARSTAPGQPPASDPGARTRRTFDPDPKATAARAARQAGAGSARLPNPPSEAGSPASVRPTPAPPAAPRAARAKASPAQTPTPPPSAKAASTKATTKAASTKAATTKVTKKAASTKAASTKAATTKVTKKAAAAKSASSTASRAAKEAASSRAGVTPSSKRAAARVRGRSPAGPAPTKASRAAGTRPGEAPAALPRADRPASRRPKHAAPTAQDTTAQDTTAQDTTAQDTTAQDTTAQPGPERGT